MPEFVVVCKMVGHHCILSDAEAEEGGCVWNALLDHWTLLRVKPSGDYNVTRFGRQRSVGHRSPWMQN